MRNQDPAAKSFDLVASRPHAYLETQVGVGKWSWDSTVQGGAGFSGLTGKLGTSTVAQVQLLTSPAEHTEVQPVFVVDGIVQPMPVRIRLSRGGGALCGGIQACAHVRVHTTPPTNLTAGGGGTDSITVGVVDEMGVGLAGKTVCAVSGGGLDLISSAGGGQQGHASNCGITDSTGNATLGPLSFPYDTTLPSNAERLLWFQAHNDFAQDDIVCLTAQHAYIPTCRSKVYGISIIPKVKSVALAASAGATERNGMLTLESSLPRFPAPATDTEPLSMPDYTDVQLPLTCDGWINARKINPCTLQHPKPLIRDPDALPICYLGRSTLDPEPSYTHHR
jgi:hypothetical protein